ncbi:hypothetical protein GGS21DRAFT_490859 [Xylaria nigripes]|nr:hypothetical protein GGS21DRAFT_490859 [Xylaria nigripes]
MLSGVSFSSTVPKTGRIYLAISWGDIEDHNSLESSIILTRSAPENATKPDGALEYYHEWKAVGTGHEINGDLHTEAGWLGQKTKLALMLELARIEHANAYALLDGIIDRRGGELDDVGGGGAVERSFVERFMMGLVAVAEDPEMGVLISETRKLALLEQAAEAISFAEVIVKDNRITSEQNVQQVGPDWQTHFMVFSIADDDSACCYDYNDGL